jgi:hypothetical protein
MTKSILAIATGVALAAATLAPTPADARDRGGAIAAGVIGGLAAGAIIGGAIASRPAYGGPVYYYQEPVYVAPPPRRCYADEEYWSYRHQAYIVRRVRVPCY